MKSRGRMGERSSRLGGVSGSPGGIGGHITMRGSLIGRRSTIG